jgi:hypothetical protein
LEAERITLYDQMSLARFSVWIAEPESDDNARSIKRFFSVPLYRLIVPCSRRAAPGLILLPLSWLTGSLLAVAAPNAGRGPKGHGSVLTE